MKFCKNCNIKASDNLKFCSNCGQPLSEIAETHFCPHCGNPLKDKGTFCPFCGKPLERQMSSVIDKQSPNDEFVVTDNNEPFFSVHHLLSFKGRRNRKEFLKMALILFFVLEIPGRFFDKFADSLDENSAVSTILFSIVLGFILDYPKYCNVAKRLHDLNWSTPVVILYLVLGVGLSFGLDYFNPITEANMNDFWLLMTFVILYFVPLFSKGTEGPNQYGPEPK